LNSSRTYINGIGLISPQHTAGTGDFLSEVIDHKADYLKCVEPNYKEFIEPLQARRMSRLIKMGITSAKLCLADYEQNLPSPHGRGAGGEVPDSIITGTGLGSVEDTEKILGTIHLDQPFLNPTPFMQSTYNTISSQIAINLKCHGYNSTYVHRTFSFESTLQDAMLQIEEGSSNTILAGGIDEMTMNHLEIVRKLGELKREPFHSLDLFSYSTPGAMAGEGSGYFLLSPEKSEKTYARLRAVETIYNPYTPAEMTERIFSLLAQNGLTASDLDVVLLGLNGHREQDAIYRGIAESAFPSNAMAAYKHLCGEYHTSSAFALWVAANMIRRQEYLSILHISGNKPASLKNILIWNHYRGKNHSLLLVTGDE
jgi:3-oxoacyl-[acyl-carrier-protein] synthase II